MNAHFEPLAGVIRVFEDGKSYGDEYVWCATCRFLDVDRVEILGVTKPMKPSVWRSIVEKFREMGVSKIVFIRKRNGGSELHEVQT